MTSWLSMVLFACAPLADRDGDGFVAADDCDDDDAAIFPGADEGVGDGVDQDCDGTEACFTDADGDGFRGEVTVEQIGIACAVDAAVPGGDCADDDAGRNPGVAEVCGTSDVDEDCDGLVDTDDVVGCFDWAGTYTGAVEVVYGIDYAFASRCVGTATAEVDAAGAVTLTGTCTLDTSWYADEFGPQAITATGASTGTYFASGALVMGTMEGGTWEGDFRPDILTISMSGSGYSGEHSVQYEGGFVGEL